MFMDRQTLVSYPLLRGAQARIRRCAKALRRVPREELSPAGQWLEDNAQFLLAQAGTLRRPFPHLPGARGVPRVMALAQRIVEQGEGDVTVPLILRAFRAFAEENAGKNVQAEITQEELGALPLALRRAVLEALLKEADAARRDADRALLARRQAAAYCEGRQDALPGGPVALARFLDQLERREDADALRRADEALARAGVSPFQARQAAEAEEARRGLLVGRLITSLRAIDRLPLDALNERLNPVARLLRAEETYRRMDGAGRGAYRTAVNRIARRLHAAETDVAQAALALAKDHPGPEGEAGYYLLERPDQIARQLGKRPGSLRPLSDARFLLPLWLGAAGTLAASVLLGAPWYAVPCILLAASDLLRQVYFAYLRRRIPARPLPRIRLARLPRDRRVLVVVPALLTSRKQALRLARQLAVLRAGNPDPGLDFMLLGDFADGPRETEPGDEAILLAAKEAVSALNEKEGGGYFYLQRARTWDAGQRAYTGRERKRGALEMLCALLGGEACPDKILYASCDLSSLRGRYAFVITLDADTLLPPGAALQLAGAMEHPLQKDRVCVIQPRMETAADRAVTRVQRWLGGPGGVDPYQLAVQDVYQDALGRGSFVGKGIFDPAAFRAALQGRLPRGRLLSHDLIEGEIAGSALAEDITLLDGHPARLGGWQKRLHRWTRGDWQLLPFLFDGQLSLLSRHKIWDNLRRSLVAPAQLFLLLLGAALGNVPLLLLGLPWPVRGMGARLLMLPGKAYTLLDAIVRALYRQFVSHQNLLSWVTAEQAEEGARPSLASVVFQAAAGAGMLLCAFAPGGCWPLSLLGMAWAGAILLMGYADGAARPAPLTPRMAASARALARDTWRFFADTVSDKTLFLPPDNVQLDPDRGAALRLSPTNAGLYLLSCCAARELGLIPSSELAWRTARALDSLESLSAWRGHLYNWYDLSTGAPLLPRFVSTVDSGNLAACLLCCAQLLRSRLSELPPEARALPARLDALARRMDFAALYDEKAHLFFVGWDADAGRPAAAHYDCLASEARLTSFVAILLRQVEEKHWRYLARAVTRAGGGTALLSWGGTMFEYLMPHLLLPLLPGTLLGEGCLSALRAQISADPRRPFGVSESGYFAFDGELNYQYRAFGLPSLSLSGETAGQVIAPYASLLALPFLPRAAGGNLLRMEKLGWRDGHGLFEAADYTPSRLGTGPRLVKSHMAHHQGMILCSICNALCDHVLVRAFMTPPAARAFAVLLEEKPAFAPRRRAAPLPPRAEKPEEAPCRRAPKGGLPPEAHVLSGGGLRWLISGKGQGRLQAGDLLLTRFSPEAGALTGPQFYFRDGKTGAALPIALRGNALFEEGAVRFSLTHGALRIALLCCVDPLLAMAVAAVRVENLSGEDREAELISFLEIAQGDFFGDRAHPNFRDLSVRVEPWGKRGLISRRLPRETGIDTPLIAHAVLGDALSLRRQGDRLLFLERSGSLALPGQLTRDADACAFRLGDVVAPCLSLRAGVRVKGGGSATVYFVTLCRESREALDQAPLSPARARAAFSLAAAQARLRLRSLRMDGRMLALYQQMAGALLFSGLPHQAALPSAPRAALWRYGVSGVSPVLLVTLLSGPDRALIRHALRCHGWLRAQGEPVDLIFFCPLEGEYFRPCRDTVETLIARSEERDAPGVFVVSGNEAEALAVESLARLTLHSGQTLARQLSALHLPPPADPVPLTAAAPSPLPPLMDETPFGGFLEEGFFCESQPAPAPWYHLACGPRFGTLVCENAILQSWAGNSRLDGLTRPCPDPHRAPASEEMCLRDGAGRVYSLIGCPAVYEPGAATYRVRAGDIQAEVTVFAAEDRPLGVRAVTLRSDTETTARLFHIVRFSLGEGGDATRCQAAEGFVFARQGDHPGVAWAHLDGARARSLSPAACIGVPSDENAPAAGPGSVGLLWRDVSLRPREAEKLTVLLGFSPSEDQARQDAAALLSQGASAALRAVRAGWGQRLRGLQCFLGDERLRRMMNLWLPYQTWAARLFARMGPYQPGGAFGFRDQLQDLLILLHTDPAAARAHILRCAAHQFPEGDVQHWWHPPHRGVRTRISDDRLFLPYLTALYVKITGDEAILAEEAPYLLSPPLSPDERERYEEPEVSPFSETLYQHCLRALDSVPLGPHGLPLMGGGDWNDGMNRVGGANGESVWLGFFLALALREFLPLCPEELRDRYREMRHRLLDSAEGAWRGQWYLRAWFDDGRPLAGPDTDPPRIDLISQCFAVLAGAPRHHAREALRHAVEELYDRDAGLVRLLTPPFTPAENAGYIGAYLPGVRENGGQYTHAVPWLILALCQLNRGDLAWEIARAVLPISHADTEEKAKVYRIEPYVLAGDVYAGENRGRGGWSWYTGSAAWLYYAVLTALLGFEKRGDRARLSPCPAPDLEEFTLVYRFGSANYHFTAAHGVLFPTLDGVKLDDGWAPLADDGRTHEARFPLPAGR